MMVRDLETTLELDSKSIADVSGGLGFAAVLGGLALYGGKKLIDAVDDKYELDTDAVESAGKAVWAPIKIPL